MNRHGITLLSLLLFSCSTTPSAPAEYPQLPEHTGGDTSESATPSREALPDAPALIVQPSQSASVVIRVVFNSGSATDPEGREGITLLTARMMREGGTQSLSYGELTEALYPMAGSIQVQVGRDQTVFVGRVHRDHLDEFYTLFRDILVRPRLANEDLERVRAQVQNALRVGLRSADDESLGKETLQAMLYEAHPYGTPTLGTERALERLQIDDLRAHRDRFFCGGRATIGISGQVPEGFGTRVQRDVSHLNSDACVGRANLPEPTHVDAPRIWIVEKSQARAVAVSMGFATEVSRAHEDYPALLLASAWLGQHRQFVGRLMQAIRGQRGMNYGDYAYADHFTQERWSRFPQANDARRQQYFSIWLRPLRPEQAHFAIRLAVRELRRFAAEGLTEAQFTNIRQFAERYFALYLQTESRRLGFAIDDAFYGNESAYLERLRNTWQAMTREELNRVIRRHLTPERLQIAIVSANAEALATRIADETPSPIEYQSEVSEEVQAEDREIIDYRLGIPRARIRIIPIDELFAE